METKAGFALEDKDQFLYNKKQKKKIIVSPDYWDMKDKSFDMVKSQLPQAGFSNEHVIKEFTPISDQGNIGSCVSNAWCDALEILMGLDSGSTPPQLSRLFAYWIFRDLVGMQYQDSGSYLRAGAQQIRIIGVVDEKYYPYKTGDVFKVPELDLFTMASNNRISSFYRISSYGSNKLDDIEKAVRANHPVVFGTIVDKDFMSYRGGGHVLNLPNTSEGRHAMIIVGVRTEGGRRQFLFRNSWSKWWGDNGHAWVDEDYVKSSQTSDIWVATKMHLM